MPQIVHQQDLAASNPMLRCLTTSRLHHKSFPRTNFLLATVFSPAPETPPLERFPKMRLHYLNRAFLTCFQHAR